MISSICQPDALLHAECRDVFTPMERAECISETDADNYADVSTVAERYFAWEGADISPAGVTRFCETLDEIDFDHSENTVARIDTVEFLAGYANPLEQNEYGKSCVDSDAYLYFSGLMATTPLSFGQWRMLGSFIQEDMGLAPQNAEFFVIEERCETQDSYQNTRTEKPVTATEESDEELIEGIYEPVDNAIDEAINQMGRLPVDSVNAILHEPEIVDYMRESCADPDVESVVLRPGLTAQDNPVLNFMDFEDTLQKEFTLSCFEFTDYDNSNR